MTTTIEKFDVLNRWTGKVAFTAEIETTPDMTRGWKLRLAVAWALAASVPCTSLNLDGADFTGFQCPAGSRFDGSTFVGSTFARSTFVDSTFADSTFARSRFDGSTFVDSTFARSRFDGSTFARSRFDGSTFVDSTFARSRFDGSTFARSRFVDSRFVDSRFDGSTFVDSTFARSTFVDSTFVDSTFDGSTFVGSTFDGKTEAREDLRKILSWAEPEIPGLVAALREGRVNGSTYSGSCACLVGTIANVRGCDVNTLEQDSDRPAERWFMMISVGDKPGDGSPGGYASAKALEWALEYCAEKGIEIPEAAQVEGSAE